MKSRRKAQEKDSKQDKSQQGKSSPTTEDVRLDKWLQVARIFKTRSQSGEAIDAGHVKMDGSRAKAGRVLKIGDEIEVQKGARKLLIKVLKIAAKPIAKELARELFEATEEVDRLDSLSAEDREQLKMMQSMDRAHQAARKGRPTKRERRDINKVKGR
jgi:ribosome-associated heat shock protein Hsp15